MDHVPDALPTIPAIAWIRREDYLTWTKTVLDRVWQPTYDHWQATAQKRLDELDARGVSVFKADVRPDAFLEWCLRTGCAVNNSALLGYGSYLAARKFLDGEKLGE